MSTFFEKLQKALNNKEVMPEKDFEQVVEEDTVLGTLPPGLQALFSLKSEAIDEYNALAKKLNAQKSVSEEEKSSITAMSAQIETIGDLFWRLVRDHFTAHNASVKICKGWVVVQSPNKESEVMGGIMIIGGSSPMGLRDILAGHR